MLWTVRSAIATVLWVAAGVLTLVFILSGAWLLLPFAFASGGGGNVLVLALAIGALAIAAFVIGRRTQG